MHIVIFNGKETDSATIDISDLQFKALKLAGDPVKVIEKAINAHLDYQMNQAKQKIAERSLKNMTAEDLDTFIQEEVLEA